MTKLPAVTLLLTALAASSCLASPSGLPGTKPNDPLEAVGLGIDDWRVEWNEGVHGVAPLYVVEIDQSWPWPQPRRGELIFVAEARCGGSDFVSLSTWPLVESERFTVFRPLSSEQHADFLRQRAELLAKIEQAERRSTDQQPNPELPSEDLTEPSDPDDPVRQPPYAELDALEASYAAAQACSFRLRAVLEDRNGPVTAEKDAEEASRTWGVVEPDGTTPDEKARERLETLIARICEHRAPDGSVPYAEECRHLRERLKRGKLAIPCSMKGRNGSLRFRRPPPGADRSGHDTSELHWGTLPPPEGGVPISGVLFLDGDYLIDHACALSTVLHEAAHSTDETITPADRALWDCLELLYHRREQVRNADAAYRRARAAWRQDPTSGNSQAMLDARSAHRTALERRDEVRDQCREAAAALGTREERAREHVQMECHAYSTEREALDAGLFGPLSDPDVMRWAKEDLVQELAAIAVHAEENPGGRGVACDCVMAAFAWLTDGEHEGLRSNLREKEALHDAIIWHLGNCSPPHPRY